MPITDPVTSPLPWNDLSICITPANQVLLDTGYFVRITCRIRRIPNQQRLSQMSNTLQPLDFNQAQDQIKLYGARKTGIEASSLQGLGPVQQPVPGHESRKTQQVVEIKSRTEHGTQVRHTTA
ncbi:hypothetical protein D3C77_208690 [compost metagenome]